MGGRRCVCGRSARFPLCDGSHDVEGWSCAATGAPIEARVFVAGPHLRNLAEQLAHGLGGVASGSVPIQAVEAVVLTDGGDGDVLEAALVGVAAGRWRVVAIDVAAEGVPLALRGRVEAVDCVEAEPVEGLWRRVAEALERPPGVARLVGAGVVGGEAASRIFLSHAAVDEAALMPAIDYLRRALGREVFVCVDSIPAGSAWFETLRGALEGCELFVFVGSPGSRASTFCAFEFGCAVAWGKAIGVISLDGAPPPAWAQTWQGVEVPRIMRLKPWLSPQEALIDALLVACGLGLRG